MAGVKERLIEFIDYLGMTRAEFEKTVGLSNGFVNNIGDGIREGSIKKIKDLYPDLNEVWLKTGAEKMLLSKMDDIRDGINIIDTQEMYERAMELGLHLIPEKNIFFQGGSEVKVNDDIEYVSRYWHIPDSEDCTAVITMSGNSMGFVIPNGTKLALKPLGWDPKYPNEIPFGSIFAIMIEDRVTGKYHGHIKYLRRHSDPILSKNFWIARSEDSKNYDDFEIDISLVRGLWIVKEYMIKTTIL